VGGIVTDQVVDNQALDLGELRERYAPNDGSFWRVHDYARSRLALLAEVERLRAERDRARDLAVALEQQTAEALRLVNEVLDRAPFGGRLCMTYLHNIQRVLGVPDDDEDVEP
jgi:hypothetical protein